MKTANPSYGCDVAHKVKAQWVFPQNLTAYEWRRGQVVDMNETAAGAGATAVLTFFVLSLERGIGMTYKEIIEAINTATAALDLLRQVAVTSGNVAGAVGSDTGDSQKPVTAQEIARQVQQIAQRLHNDVSA